MQPRNNEDYSENSLVQDLIFSSSATKLQRTELTWQDKVLFSACALARKQEHGAKSELARQFEVSRPTVYSAIDTASSVLIRHFDEQKSKVVMVQVDEAQLHRTVVALRAVAPNALRPIEELISIVYPDVHISYGKIQQIVSEAERKAFELNSKMDMSKVEGAALDEMFSQGSPVLGGVDLDSGALFALCLRESRAAEDWAEVLDKCKRQGLVLQTVVKDAALGIECGVNEVYPDAEQRDDCFHAHYQMGKVRRCLEQKAYGAISREQEAQKKLSKLRRTGRTDCGSKRSKLVHEQVMAKKKCQQALALHDTFEIAMRKVQEAMEIVDLETGKIRTAEQSRTAIQETAAVMMKLDEPKCRKVGKYIYNRAVGLSKYMIQMNQLLQQLIASYGPAAVSTACVLCRLVREIKRKRYTFESKLRKRKQHLLGALATLHRLFGEQAKVDALLDSVDKIFEHRHRASSAIEGFNAALRPFLYVHKGVSQNFLELFRAYYNLRTRRWGRHKGTSAYQCLTGVKVDDWLSVLGFPPSAPRSICN